MQPQHGHQAAQDGHHRVVDVGDADHRGDHGGWRSSVAFVPASRSRAFVASRKALRLSASWLKTLTTFWPRDHLLDVAVQLAQVLLLVVVIVACCAVPL